MSIFAGVAGAVREARGRLTGGTLEAPPGWLESAFGAQPTVAGVDVTEWGALNFSAVYAAVRILAESVATLPLRVYRRLPKGRELAGERAESRMLAAEPNSEMSALAWREAAMAHVLLWGNAYAELEWDGAGRLVAIWPIRPDRVTVRRLSVRDARGRVASRVVYEVAQAAGGPVTLEAADVLHVAGLSFDGLRGFSPIRLAREAIGLGLAVETYGAAFFGNGSRPGGYLKAPGVLSEPAKVKLRRAWEELHRGPAAAHRTAVLEGGLDWVALGVPPEEAQFLQTRRFQLSEIARIYRVPPHMLADLEKATFSNIEHLGLEFVQHSLLPWLVRWEQELNRKLFGAGAELYCRHEVAALLRGDVKSRYEAHALGRMWGWLSADDVRELEELNPLPDGSGALYLSPVNMAVAGTLPAGQSALSSSKAWPSPAPAGSRLELELEGEPERSSSAADLAAACRVVLEAVVARFVARESHALGRIARRPGKLEAALADVAEFYASSRGVLEAELEVVARAFPGLAPAPAELAGEYCGESEREVGGLVAELGEAGAWREAVLERVAEWARSRPAVVGRLVEGVAA